MWRRLERGNLRVGVEMGGGGEGGVGGKGERDGTKGKGEKGREGVMEVVGRWNELWGARYGIRVVVGVRGKGEKRGEGEGRGKVRVRVFAEEVGGRDEGCGGVEERGMGGGFEEGMEKDVVL